MQFTCPHLQRLSCGSSHCKLVTRRLIRVVSGYAGTGALSAEAQLQLGWGGRRRVELAGRAGRAGRGAEGSAKGWDGQSELVGQRSYAVCFSQQAEVAEAISAVGGVSLGGGGLSLQEARVDGCQVGRSARGSVESWPGGDQLAARNRSRGSRQ
jgi:hypothetical protein